VSKKRGEGGDVRDDLGGFDRLFEHRVRLAIGVLLTRNDSLTFPRLKALLGETDGSLGAHLRRMENAGYVDVSKEFRNRKPVSWYTLTAAGRKALSGHLGAVEQLIRRVKGAC
jgi:DNA-binding MarR family transcriptional regulator